MNVDPRRIFVEHGTYRRPSVDVVLVGPRVVDTAWAIGVLAVRPPLNCPWHVRSACDDERDDNSESLIENWLADPAGSSHLLIWPAGQYLAWNAIVEGVKSGAARTRMGAATLYCRWEDPDARDSRTLYRLDLALDPADAATSAGHPVVADQPDARVDPAMSVVIGIPSLGRTSLLWAAHLGQLAMPIGTACSLIYLEGFEVADARERIVDQVLGMKPRPAFLLFLGDDNLPPSGMFQKLYDDLQAFPDVAAVGGLYRTKTDPPQVCAWKDARTLREGVDYKPGEIMAVRTMGLDACLLRTEWLARVPGPRFATVQDVGRQNTEDCHLWVRGREATGRDPWLDTGIGVGHIDLKNGRIY